MQDTQESIPIGNGPPDLPAEIWAHTFLLACPAPSLEEFRLISSKNHRRRLFNLTHVCGKWRDIAHSTSELWSTIGIELLNTSQQEREWVDFCVNKSLHASTLSVILAVRSAPRSHPHWQKGLNRKTLTEFFSVSSPDPRLLSAIQHASRWEQFSVILSQPPIMESILHLFSSCIQGEPLLPRLCSFRVSLSPVASDCNYWGLRRPAHELNVLQSAPHLKSVSFITERVAWAPTEGMPWYSPIPIPLSQLSELILEPASSDQTHLLLGMLAGCPELRYLRLGYLMEDEMDFGSLSSLQFVRLEHLEGLSISGEDHAVASLLDSIEVPSLQHFALSIETGAWPQASIMGFLSSVSATLTKLEIGGYYLSTGMLVPWLPLIPKLEVLSITGSLPKPRLAERLLQALTITNADHADTELLPLLTTFHLTHRLSTDIDLELFQKMVQSRGDKSRTTRLRSASIDVTADVHVSRPHFRQESFDKLVEMKKSSGLCINIFYKVGNVSRRML
ncbi:hypothetical protein VNI00_002271 [Paramarasmius palmivorus]|uniref:F-box domain-containing protein n=1 Tax=Paramarasmius palmivorus TaxID=297713 RepID=A0AAW0E2A7_9AGAR